MKYKTVVFDEVYTLFQFNIIECTNAEEHNTNFHRHKDLIPIILCPKEDSNFSYVAVSQQCWCATHGWSSGPHGHLHEG